MRKSFEFFVGWICAIAVIVWVVTMAYTAWRYLVG